MPSGQTGSRSTRIKTAACKVPRARGSAFGWPDVLRAVQGPETRERVLANYEAAGFRPRSFRTRSNGAESPVRGAGPD